MIEQLPAVEEPEWLSRIESTTIREAPFPLADILRASLYYPSAGFDGDPVRYLAGNVVSFVFVDYGKSDEDLTAELTDPKYGFRGYEVIASRPITEEELAPRGWTPSYPSPADGDPSRYRDWMKRPFCLWIILQRRREMPTSHGPHRFSLLYLCADGVAAFQALYVANGATPDFVTVIQPGHGFGANWTNFEDPEMIFARSVIQNPSGKPSVLLFGGIGSSDFYDQPCWPEYSEFVCFLAKAGGGTIGVWRHAQQQHAAEGATRRR
jgi:hypothetical protein